MESAAAAATSFNNIGLVSDILLDANFPDNVQEPFEIHGLQTELDGENGMTLSQLFEDANFWTPMDVDLNNLEKYDVFTSVAPNEEQQPLVADLQISDEMQTVEAPTEIVVRNGDSNVAVAPKKTKKRSISTKILSDGKADGVVKTRTKKRRSSDDLESKAPTVVKTNKKKKQDSVTKRGVGQRLNEPAKMYIESEEKKNDEKLLKAIVDLRHQNEKMDRTISEAETGNHKLINQRKQLEASMKNIQDQLDNNGKVIEQSALKIKKLKKSQKDIQEKLRLKEVVGETRRQYHTDARKRFDGIFI